MEAQLTVRIPEDLKQALDDAARKRQRKSSEIVRMALRAFLLETREGKERPADRVDWLIGSLDSGMPHLAERHREYIIESLKNGR